MSISNFPDNIEVTFGSAWNSGFSEDETLVLQSAYSDAGLQVYSEDGTQAASATNRIMLALSNYGGTYDLLRFFTNVDENGVWWTAAKLQGPYAGTDYSFKEIWNANELFQILTFNGSVEAINRTSGTKTAVQSIFKNLTEYPVLEDEEGGGGGGSSNEMFAKCKPANPFRNGYAVTNANITGGYDSKAPEREINTFDSGLITNRLSGRFDDRGYYGR